MGKVQILAVLTMDGCQSSELCCKAYKELRLEDCGINKIRENALYHITPDYSLMEKRRHKHPLSRGSHTGHGGLYQWATAYAHGG